MVMKWITGKFFLIKKTHDSVFEDHKDIKKACLANHTVQCVLSIKALVYPKSNMGP